METQYQGIGFSVQVAFTGQEVKSEETVVAPAFPYLKIASKFSHYVFARVSACLVDHFYTVFISAKQKNYSNKATLLTMEGGG